MQKRRIATLITGLGLGGAEMSLLRLVRETADSVEHCVIGLRGQGELLAELSAAGAEVHLTNMRLSTSISSTVEILKILNGFKPDVVFSRMYHACLVSTAVQRLLKSRPPLYWSIHHSLDDIHAEARSTKAAIRLCRMLSSAPDAIIYNSRRSAQQHQDYGYVGDPIIIPGGCDTHLFAPDREDGARARKALGFSESDFVLLHVGRAHPVKDHALLLTAFALAAEESPHLKLVLVGQGTESLSIPNSCAPSVRVLGARRDVQAIMRAADTGILTSKSESFPNVLTEFQACGRPVITTDVGDAAEMARYGVVLPSRNPEAMAAEMVRMSQAPKHLLSQMGEAARGHIVSDFSLQATVERYLKLWHDAPQAAR